jgi:hypothetical protein
MLINYSSLPLFNKKCNVVFQYLIYCCKYCNPLFIVANIVIPSMPLGCNFLLSYAITSDIDGQENCMS